jgi:hypothetical protein
MHSITPVGDARQCDHCGADYYRGTESAARFRRRRYCSVRCATAVNNAPGCREGHDEALIEDVEFLLGTDTMHNIANRLGFARPDSLARRMYRVGRPDLAQVLQRAEVSV